MPFKPLLAGKADLSKLRFPLLASPKIDGVRASVVGGQLRSRSLKPFANKFTQLLYSRRDFEGFDGEFTLGSPTAKDVFLRSSEVLRRFEGEPALTYWLFDDWDHDGVFQTRYDDLCTLIRSYPTGIDLRVVPHVLIHDMAALNLVESEWVGEGYEGVMLRDPKGPYKYGRSTTNEGILLKVKRFEDAEAVIVGIEEEMHNANEATTNELGRTKRSSHKAGKVGKGTMGALQVCGLNGQFKDVHFNIGAGFTAAQRAEDWVVGTIVRYKYFAVGVKDKPRHPVYQGRRLAEDM